MNKTGSTKPQLRPLVDYKAGDRVRVTFPATLAVKHEPDYEGVIVGAGLTVGQWLVKSAESDVTKAVHNQFITRIEGE